MDPLVIIAAGLVLPLGRKSEVEKEIGSHGGKK